MSTVPSDQATEARSGFFVPRHIGTTADEREKMAAAVGVASPSDLPTVGLPADVRDATILDLLPAVSERALLDELRQIAAENVVSTSMIGLGFYDTILPAVLRRSILENPAWYTAYTPYQAEISQGRLEALLLFQTMISDLTGLPIANASMLDESSAVAEAMLMCRRAGADAPRFIVDKECFPQTIAVLETRARPLGIELVVADLDGGLPDLEAFGVMVQYPGASGVVRDLAPILEAARARQMKSVVAADLLALTLLVPPGEAGADIAVGTTQRFGLPMGFGGPHAGYLAATNEFARAMPGRIVGVSRDRAGNRALQLALQTREQHIRREKATSNICTAEVLPAVLAAMYAVHHGPDGLREIATRAHHHSARIASALSGRGLELASGSFFDTVTVRVPGAAAGVVRSALDAGINLRLIDADTVGISCDEVTTDEIVDAVLGCFDATGDATGQLVGIPDDLRRTSGYLAHPAFSRYRAESALTRFLRRLSDRDLALDRTMIPLGSCTMKLNAAIEMEPVTWPEIGGLHPFAPVDQTAGMRRIITDLEEWLCGVTGYAAVSLQPNAGSQGELAGLLAIRAYHRANGNPEREICLVPASAHGTNPASAVLAGMRVVVVACDGDGNIDVDDLEQKLAEHGERVGALMVTYPSTSGIYEPQIRRICDLVHAAGGQVYLDGANLNALVGAARPGTFADASHLNLHKTFCIPHGGGGPGVGPVAVAQHLAPYLPSHPFRVDAGPAEGIGPLTAAPFGSAGILVIPWVYIRLMGGAGLQEATQAAVLGANYLAERLAPHYPVLYRGADGTVAHECIVDVRPFAAAGIRVDDVAKRLIDYGFHAPTMSFPVAGTLMIEPTESEGLEELDRFVEAMVAIRGEIEEVVAGRMPADDNPVTNAPHTAEELTGEWHHPYSSQVAAFPVPSLRAANGGNKYWSPVKRVDVAHGDRNLCCSLPPTDAYAELGE